MSRMVSIYRRQKLGAAEHLFNLKNNYYFYFYVVRQKLILTFLQLCHLLVHKNLKNKNI